MKIYYLSSDNLEKYRDKIEDNIEQYKDGKLRFVHTSDLIEAPKLKAEDFKLSMSKTKPNETDYENIKIVYLALKNLTDSQATEERLWAGLCHSPEFWDYMKYRWKCEDKRQVLDRFFFRNEGRAIFYNGLARLWWYGKMTYNENSKEPFELTKYICENLTTKGLLTMTFAFSHNRNICQAYLKTMMKFEKKHKLSEEEYLESRRIVNSWGGNTLLDDLSEEEFEKKLNNYLNNMVEKRKP